MRIQTRRAKRAAAAGRAYMCGSVERERAAI